MLCFFSGTPSQWLRPHYRAPNSITDSYMTSSRSPCDEFREPHAVQLWTFVDAALSRSILVFHLRLPSSSLIFLPFKMNDWRFFNVSQNQFFFTFGFNHSLGFALFCGKKYLYLLIEIRKKNRIGFCDGKNIERSSKSFFLIRAMIELKCNYIEFFIITWRVISF